MTSLPSDRPPSQKNNGPWGIYNPKGPLEEYDRSLPAGIVPFPVSRRATPLNSV